MKFQVLFILVALVCLIQANATMFTNRIEPVNGEVVEVTSLSATLANSVTASTTNFVAGSTGETSSFNLSGLGEVGIVSEKNLNITSQETTSIKSTGTSSMSAKSTSITSSTFKATSFQSISLDATKVQISAPDGPLDVSGGSLEVSGSAGVVFGSTRDNVEITTKSTSHFTANVIQFAGGNAAEKLPITFSSGRSFVKASQNFEINSLLNIGVSSQAGVQLVSPTGLVEVEAIDQLTLAGANIDSFSYGNYQVESLLNKIDIQSKSLVSFEGHALRLTPEKSFNIDATQAVTFSAAGSFLLEAPKSIALTSKKSINNEGFNIVYDTNGAINAAGASVTLTSAEVNFATDPNGGAINIGSTSFNSKSSSNTILSAKNIFINTKSIGKSILVQSTGGDVRMNTGDATYKVNTKISFTSKDILLQSANQLNLASAKTIPFQSQNDLTVVGQLQSTKGTFDAAFIGTNDVKATAASIVLTAADNIVLPGAATTIQAATDLTIFADHGVSYGNKIDINVNGNIVGSGDNLLFSAANALSLVGNFSMTLKTNKAEHISRSAQKIVETAPSILVTTPNFYVYDIGSGASELDITTNNFTVTATDLLMLQANTGTITVDSADIAGQPWTFTNGNINIEAVDDVTLTSLADRFILTAAKAISFESEESKIHMTATKKAFLTTAADLKLTASRFDKATAMIQSNAKGIQHNTTNGNLVLKGGDVELDATLDLSFSTASGSSIVFTSANNRYIDFVTAGTHSVVATDEVVFTSNNDMTFRTNPLTLTTSQNLQITGTGVDKDVLLRAANDISFIHTNNATITASHGNTLSTGASTTKASAMEFIADKTGVTSGGDIFVQTQITTFNVAQNTDISNALTMAASQVELKACLRDLAVRGKALSVKTATEKKGILLQYERVCGSKINETFEITLSANEKQTLSSAFIKLTTVNDLIIDGGGVGFDTRTSKDRPGADISVVSTNGVAIGSFGEDDFGFNGATDDLYQAANEIDIAATKGIQFISNSIDDHPFQAGYGMLVEADAKDFNMLAPNGEINVAATSVALSNSDNELSVLATSNIVIKSGSLYSYAGGVHKTAAVAAGIGIIAQNGDISVTSAISDIYAAGLTGIKVIAQSNDLTFTAKKDIDIKSTQINAPVQMHSVLGKVDITSTLQDVYVTAGTTNVLGTATMITSQDLSLTSGQTQRYHQKGRTTARNKVAVVMEALTGNIAINGQLDLLMDASGVFSFLASAKDIEITSEFKSTNLRSTQNHATFTSAQGVEVTATRNIKIAAQGGGGSVSIVSDSLQDIKLTAATTINMKSKQEGTFQAKNAVKISSTSGDITVDLQGNGLNEDTIKDDIDELAASMEFQAGGKIVATSKGSKGVNFDARYNMLVNAEQNLNFDGSSFTIGQSSLSSLATQPRITMRAGGDSVTEGFTINSASKITMEGSGLSNGLISGNFLDFDVTDASSFTSLGSFHYQNHQVDNDGATQFTSLSTAELKAAEDISITGTESLTATTTGPFFLQSTGTDVQDGMFITSKRDVRVTTGINTFAITAEASVEARDIITTATKTLSITNQNAQGGSTNFDSDGFLTATSEGTTSFISRGTGFFRARTEGDHSDLTIDTLVGDISFTSTESFTAQGSRLDLDARTAFTFSVPNANMLIEATDNIDTFARGTISFKSTEDISIDTLGTEPDNDITIDSSATIVTTAQDDISFSADDILFFADTTLAVSGEDIRFENYKRLDLAARDDVLIDAVKDFTVQLSQTATFDTQRNINFKTTASNADIVFVSENAQNRLKFAGITMTSATKDITFKSNKDMTISVADDHASTGFSAVARDDVLLTATNNFQATSEAGVSIISTAGAIPIRSTAATFAFTAQGPRVEVDANTNVLFNVLSAAFTISSSDPADRPNHSHIFEATASGATKPQILFTTTNANDKARIQFKRNRDLILQADNQVRMASTKTMKITAPHQLSISGSGSNVDGSGGFGVHFVSSKQMTFTNGGSVSFKSAKGRILFGSSEKTQIGTLNTPRVLLDARHQLQVLSTFDASFNAKTTNAAGVTLSSAAGTIALSATHGNVRLIHEDVSISAKTALTITAEGEASSMKFTTLADAVLTSKTGFTLNALNGDINIASTDNIAITTKTQGTTFESLGSAVYSTGAATGTAGVGSIHLRAVAGAININAARGIYLGGGPEATVDFQSPKVVANLIDTNTNGQTGFRPDTLHIPDLDKIAGSTQQTFNLPNIPYHQDQHVRTCENRQLGVASTDQRLCVCVNYQWRCIAAA